MEEPQSPKKGSVFQMAAENADVRSTDSLSKYLADSYTTTPPELTELFAEIPSLSKLGELIHNVFLSAEIKDLTPEVSQLCEKATRYLINDYKTQKESSEQASKSLGRSKRLVDYAALLAQNPTDITLAKLQIIELQRENQELQQKMDDISNEIKVQQDECEKLFQEKIELTNKLTQQANEHKNDISKLRFEYSQLADSQQNAIDQSKLAEVQITDLKKLLAAANDDSSSHKREVEELKATIASKNQLINKYRQQLKSKDQQFSDFKDQKERETLELSTTLMSQNNLLEDKNNAAMKKLARYIKNQAGQIEILTQANRKATTILDKQNYLLDKYEDELVHSSNVTEDLNRKLADLRDENVMLKDRIETQDQNSNKDNEELVKLRGIVEAACLGLAPAYSVTPDQLPSICHELSGTRIDPETAKNLRALNAICDGLGLFIINLLRTGEANLEFLRENPLKFTSTMKSDIKHEIEKTRLFLGTLSYSDATEDKVMKYLLNPEANFDPDFNSDTQLSAVLTEVLRREREFMSKMFDNLEQVREVLPAFDCKTHELPEALSTYLLQMKPVFKDLLSIISSTLHYHGSLSDIFACLCKYIEETSQILQVMDDEIRPLIKFNGKIVDMPQKLIDVLVEYKDTFDNLDTVSKRELTDATIDFEKKKSLLMRENDGLKDKIGHKDKVINSLQKQLEKLASDLEDSKTSESALTMMTDEASKNNKILSSSKQTLEDTISRLNQENQRLEQLLENKQNNYERRLNELIEKERAIQKQTQEREKKRYEEQINVLEKQVSDLNTRIQEEQLQHMTNERNLKKQAQTFQRNMRRLEQDKLDLSTTVEHLQNEPMSNQIIDDLMQKLSDARIKNKELLCEINRLRNTNTSPQVSTRSINSPSKTVSQSSMSVSDERTFIDKVGEVLDEFIGKEVTWTKQRVHKTVEAMTEHIKNLEQSLDKKQQRTLWSQWAEETLKSLDPKYKGGISDNEMRQKLADYCVASGNRTKMIDMITTLREEKSHLLSQVNSPQKKGTSPAKSDKTPEKSEISTPKSATKSGETKTRDVKIDTEATEDTNNEGKQTFKSWALVGLFVALSRKDNGVSRFEKTPASPPAIRGQFSLLK